MVDFERFARMALRATERAGGRSAIYHPPAGADISCCALVDRADDLAEIAGASFVAAKWRIEVRKSFVAAPVKGGVFRIGASSYVITSVPHLADPDGLVWVCLCDPE